MIKRMLTMLVVLALMANAVAAFSPGGDGEQCTEACCAATHCEAVTQLLLAAQCCTINSQQDAESNLPQSLPITIQKQGIKAASDFWLLQTYSTCLKQRKFPSSPTRHLAGSTSRYLENNTFLI